MPSMLLIASLLLLPGIAAGNAASPVLGQTAAQAPAGEPIVTDRPDFTESTSVVPAGRVQLEAGYTRTHNSGVDEHTLGEVLLRFGLAERWELRLEAPSIALLRGAGDQDDSGLTDMSAGFKYRIGEQSGALPAMAVIGALVLPTGSDPFSADTLIPEVALAWSYELSDRASLGGNVNAAFPEDAGGDRTFEPSASVALGLALTDAVGAFVEYFGFYPAIADSGTDTHYADAGLTYLITADLQLDVRAGVGLNSHANDHFVGAGFAVRW